MKSQNEQKETKMRNKNQQQQGDVYFERIAKMPRGAVKVKKQDGVFAWGEVTNHKHVATASDAVTLYEKDGIKYAHVSAQTSVVHEEHHAQVLEPGVYEYGQVTEYDYLAEMARTVVD